MRSQSSLKAPAVAALLAILTGCGGNGTAEPSASTASASSSPEPDATATPFPDRSEPIAVEPGTYRVARSAWSVAGFTVTFPEGWTVQYGHVYASKPDEDDEFGFYAVVVDAIYADACEGETGEVMQVGPTVDDLAAALLRQPGAMTSGPIDTSLGGYPAARIDFTIPEGFDLEPCSLGEIGLQIWYSPPADKYFVLLPDGFASAYIVDVAGQRQVFLTQHRSSTSDEDVQELRAILDSISLEP